MNKYLLKIIIFVILITGLLVGLVMSRFEVTSRLFFLLELLALLLLIAFCASVIPRALYHYHLYLNRRTYRQTTEDCEVYYNDSEIILCPQNHTAVLFAPGEPFVRISRESPPNVIGNVVLESRAASHVITEQEVDSEYQKVFKFLDCKNYQEFDQKWGYIIVSRAMEGSEKNRISIWLNKHQELTDEKNRPNIQKENVSAHPAAIGDAILKIIRKD